MRRIRTSRIRGHLSVYGHFGSTGRPTNALLTRRVDTRVKQGFTSTKGHLDEDELQGTK